MTRVCCPSCRLRFTDVPAKSLLQCPVCGGELRRFAHAREALGYQLLELAVPQPGAVATVTLDPPAPDDA